MIEYLANGSLILSICFSVLCIGFFVRAEYRHRLIYQLAIATQFVNLALSIARLSLIYQLPWSKYLTAGLSFMEDIVIYSIVNIDLNILLLFSTLDNRLKPKLIVRAMYVSVIFAIWIESTYIVYVITGIRLFYDVNQT